jgi:hypothetical protein
MHIQTIWFGDQFNVELCSQQGREPFISIKGVRIKSGSKGEWLAWPANPPKNDNGKWWNHVYASEAFNAEVMKIAKASMPTKDTRTHGERKARQQDDDSDVPF